MTGTGIAVVSDSAGHFVLANVPAGAHRLQMQHDALDLIGLTSVGLQFTAGDATPPLTIAIPAFASLYRATCGKTVPPLDTGFVFGSVRQLRPSGTGAVHVVVSWVDLAYSKQSGLAQKRWTLETTTDSVGNYALCGVPGSTGLTMHASSGESATDEISLLPLGPDRLTRRDFVVANGTAQAHAIVTGSVVDQARRPIPNAEISIGDAITRSDSAGDFALTGIPSGTRELRARAIGFDPASQPVDILRDTTSAAIVMNRITTLDSVSITARTARGVALVELEERRKSGFGYFRDSAAVSMHPDMLTIFREIPSVIIQGKFSKGRILFHDSGQKFSGAVCDANLWIDNVRQWDQEELFQLHPDEIAAIETFPRMADTPVKYIYRGSTLSQCGTILVWTKRYIH